MSAPPPSPAVIVGLDGCVATAPMELGPAGTGGLDISDLNPPNVEKPFEPVHPMTTLVTKDGARVEVKSEYIAECKVLVAILVSDPSAKELPINVDEKTLRLIMAYLELYCRNGKPAMQLPSRPIQNPNIVIWAPWSDEWLRALAAPVLYDLVIAANYLDVSHLVIVCGIMAAVRLVGKPREEIDAVVKGVADVDAENAAVQGQ